MEEGRQSVSYLMPPNYFCKEQVQLDLTLILNLKQKIVNSSAFCHQREYASGSGRIFILRSFSLFDFAPFHPG